MRIRHLILGFFVVSITSRAAAQIMFPPPTHAGTGSTASSGGGGPHAFKDAALEEVPVLVPLTHGAVLGSLKYLLEVPVLSMSGPGLAPGIELSLRLLTGASAGNCGVACSIAEASLDHDAAAGTYTFTGPDGSTRRFAWNGTAYLEQPKLSGAPLVAATLVVLANGSVNITEPGGRQSYKFAASGQLSEISNPWGTLTIARDGGGNATSISSPAGVATLSYRPDGLLQSVTDPEGYTVTLEYDWMNQLSTAHGPNYAGGFYGPGLNIAWASPNIISVSEVGMRATSLSYSSYGGSDDLVLTADDTRGNAYAFAADATRVAFTNAESEQTTLDVQVDTLGHHHIIRIQTSDGARIEEDFDSTGHPLAHREYLENEVLSSAYFYDVHHRLAQVTSAEGSTNFTYPSDSTRTIPSSMSSQDNYGNTFTLTLNSAGDVLTKTVNGHTESFSYNSSGDLTGAVDEFGNISSRTVDANGLVLSETAFGATTQTTYNLRGQIASMTDARGVRTDLTYDVKGRLASSSNPHAPGLSITRTNGENGEQSIATTVGTRSFTKHVDVHGRTLSTEGPFGSKTLSYDDFTGRRNGVTSTFRGQTKSSSWSLTNTGTPNSVTVNGRMVQSADRISPPGFAFPPEL